MFKIFLKLKNKIIFRRYLNRYYSTLLSRCYHLVFYYCYLNSTEWCNHCLFYLYVLLYVEEQWITFWTELKSAFSQIMYHCRMFWHRRFVYGTLSEKEVVYFDQLLGAGAPKSCLNYFFSTVFNLFFHFKPFSVISRLKSTKKVWKRNVFLSTPQSWATCKS